MNVFLLAGLLGLRDLMNGLVTSRVGIKPVFEFPLWIASGLEAL